MDDLTYQAIGMMEQQQQIIAVAETTPSMPLRRPFDPAAHDLDPSFRLTKFTDLKGWGCKVPQEVLLKLLEGLNQDGNQGNIEGGDPGQFGYMSSLPRVGKYGSQFVEVRNGGHFVFGLRFVYDRWKMIIWWFFTVCKHTPQNSVHYYHYECTFTLYFCAFMH